MVIEHENTDGEPLTFHQGHIPQHIIGKKLGKFRKVTLFEYVACIQLNDSLQPRYCQRIHFQK